MGEKRNAYTVLVEKPAGKRPLERRTYRGEDIKMDVNDIGWEGVDWIGLTQDRDKLRPVVNTGMNIWVPYNAWNLFTD
jgi:hypothetical protein